ncbi:PAS-domain containing protein [Candidatus Terasakiella magnetica]|uniref:PAS-domain containing protein n=1 Tax=Candidatus Terasakiella magnetica TaxID=1867952 RepID=UPI0013F4C115|nr:PAS-domain containing protein [Candidatus Terasakiella magnetica]
MVGFVLIGLIYLYAQSLKNDVEAVNARNNQQVSSNILVLKNHIKNLILYTEVLGRLEAKASIENAEKANDWAQKNFESFLINVPELFGFALVEKGQILLKAGFQENDIPDELIISLGKPKSIFPARLEVRKEISTKQSKLRLLPLTQRIVQDKRKIFGVVLLSAPKIEELIKNANEENIIHSSLVDNAGRVLVSGHKGQTITKAQDELSSLLNKSVLGFSDVIASEKGLAGKEINYLAVPVSPFPINLIAIYRPVMLFAEQINKIVIFSVIVISAFSIFVFFFYRTSTKLDAHQGHLESLVEERTQELEERTGLLQTVLASMTVGIVAFNKDLKLIAWNKQFLKIRDYPEELVKIGTEFSVLMDFDSQRHEFGDELPELSTLDLIERSKRFEYHEFERKRPDGRYIEVRGGPIPGGGFVSTYTDISERKENEKMLREAYSIISDSIDYAANIQRSILPNIHKFADIFEDYCVFWEPRDRVGGDMYWVRKWGDGDLILLGDCTGHGVPGAFMTLIVTGALDGALDQVEPGNVSALLQYIHQNVQNSLSQDQEHGTSDDGLEVGACFLSKNHKELTYSGARFSLFKIENDEVVEIKGTKKGIGYRMIPYDQNYPSHCIELNDTQSFFLTTDGLIDQIGGERKRMFGKKRFKNLLLSLRGVPLFEQKFRILEAVADYQGYEIRRDDMALISFKVKQDQDNHDYII